MLAPPLVLLASPSLSLFPPIPNKKTGARPVFIFQHYFKSFTSWFIISDSKEIIIVARMAIPKPSMTKLLPNKACVIIRVIALITNKNNPSVINVMGRVSTTKMGLTMTFNTDKIKLAIIAVTKLSR
ncbi:hypothetical protein N782_04090 [Pontibacillus yanchengensis Y32]|uniref:Uncharacterized protein n=1 Tax=Pontibacillus yanchengensis Y32 TaxID=1385514 RepID=A0A0A2TCN0_9BACI|nr:hypothetical protein N782_04090 [Pontibacillus yanchengensis Y32]